MVVTFISKFEWLLPGNRSKLATRVKHEVMMIENKLSLIMGFGW